MPDSSMSAAQVQEKPTTASLDSFASSLSKIRDEIQAAVNDHEPGIAARKAAAKKITSLVEKAPALARRAKVEVAALVEGFITADATGGLTEEHARELWEQFVVKSHTAIDNALTTIKRLARECATTPKGGRIAYDWLRPLREAIETIRNQYEDDPSPATPDQIDDAIIATLEERSCGAGASSLNRVCFTLHKKKLFASHDAIVEGFDRLVAARRVKRVTPETEKSVRRDFGQPDWYGDVGYRLADPPQLDPPGRTSHERPRGEQEPAWRRLKLKQGDTGGIAVLDGKTFRLAAHRFAMLNLLQKAKGEAVTASTIEATGISKPRREYGNLPEPLKAIIDAPDRGSVGYMML